MKVYLIMFLSVCVPLVYHHIRAARLELAAGLRSAPAETARVVAYHHYVLARYHPELYQP